MSATQTSRPARIAPKAAAPAPAVRFSPPGDARAGRAPRPGTPPAGNSRAQDPDQFVTSMDDDFLSCRGDRHNFPKFRATRNGKLPRGIKVTRQRDGCFQITSTCPDCGTERWRVTLPGGRYDASAAYRYRHPKGYLSPRDAGLARSDFTAEILRRALEGGLLK